MILSKDIQVVVLMGGLGTRLGKYTDNCPKPLVDISGKPFFEYQLELLRSWGFTKFLFLVGYRARQIEDYFQDGSKFHVQIRYSYDGEELLGTGGAIRRALSELEEEFMLIYGDSFMDINYEELLYRYSLGKMNGAQALMAIYENKDNLDRSNVVYEDGVLKLYDKQSLLSSMHYIDYGIGVYQRQLFTAFNSNVKFDVSVIQHELSVSGEIVPYVATNRFYEIGTPNALAVFKKYADDRWYQPHKAVFLDRDGVINQIVFNDDTEQLDSPLSITEFKFIPRVQEALKILQEKNFILFVVTNQPAAAKGKTTLLKLFEINNYMQQELLKKEVFIREVAMCPHTEKVTGYGKIPELIKKCECRKPKPGMIKNIMSKYLIDVSHSFMVGDSCTDILAGKNVGLKTVFLGDFKCDLCAQLQHSKPDAICNDLYDFAIKIERGIL